MSEVVGLVRYVVIGLQDVVRERNRAERAARPRRPRHVTSLVVTGASSPIPLTQPRFGGSVCCHLESCWSAEGGGAGLSRSTDKFAKLRGRRETGRQGEELGEELPRGCGRE